MNVGKDFYKTLYCNFAAAPINPCQPSPCGPNSECHVVGERAACSCRAGYLGAPPACRPECAVSSDCPMDRACISHKCKDPCVHSCGLDARCHVVGHNPICTCPEHSPEGDPFIRCYRKSKNIRMISYNPNEFTSFVYLHLMIINKTMTLF